MKVQNNFNEKISFIFFFFDIISRYNFHYEYKQISTLCLLVYIQSADKQTAKMIEKNISEETTPCLPKSKETSIFRMVSVQLCIKNFLRN